MIYIGNLILETMIFEYFNNLSHFGKYAFFSFKTMVLNFFLSYGHFLEKKYTFSTMVQRSLKTKCAKTAKNIFWVGYPGLKSSYAGPKIFFKDAKSI